MFKWISLLSLMLFSFQVSANQCAARCDISKFAVEETIKSSPPCHQKKTKNETTTKHSKKEKNDNAEFSSVQHGCNGVCFDDLAFSSDESNSLISKADAKKVPFSISALLSHNEYLVSLDDNMGFVPAWKDPPLNALPLYLRIQRLLN